MKDNKNETIDINKIYVSLSTEEYRRLKVRLYVIQNSRVKKAILTFAFISLIVMMMAFVLLYELGEEFSLLNIVICLIISVVLGGIISVYFLMISEMRESSLRGRILEYEAENLKDTVEDDIFENSIKMSYKYLDQYYLQTREQAQRGFAVTVGVAIFGGVLVTAGIIAMYFGAVAPSYLTCATGVIIEFIASILFYLYNRTVSSMSKYHNKLVLSQNISLSLKVAESLPEEKRNATKELIVAELLKDINCHLITDDKNTSYN